MSNVVVNANNMDGLGTHVWRAAEVPEEVWPELQGLHYESVKSHLPQEEWARASVIARVSDLDTYVQRRKYPQTQSGQDGWNLQLLRDPLVAITYEGQQIVAAALSDTNTSGRGSHLKMAAPIIGKRYIHIREVYSNPDVQGPLDVTEGTKVVSGLILGGIYHSLQYRRQYFKAKDYEKISAYVVTTLEGEIDPADLDLGLAVMALNMIRTPRWEKKAPAGYREGSKLWRYTKVMKAAINTIEGFADSSVITQGKQPRSFNLGLD